MRFEIIGEISEIETFAVGSSIREIARLRRVYGRGRWRSARASLPSGWRMAPCIMLKYIGTKRPESDARNSK